MFKLSGIGFHELNDGVQRVGHVHHIHVHALRNWADKRFTLHGCVVDFHSVVGCTPAG